MGHSAQQRFNKEGLFALGLKGWEECGYTDGVGRRGHFRQGVGGSKGEETAAGTQCWRRATKSAGSRAQQEIRWGVSTGPVRSWKATLANEASRTVVVGWRAVA